MNYFSKNYKTIFSSEFLRNSASLISGSTIAQLISIGTAPILYRIYSKSDYGLLGLYMAVTGLVGAFSTLQYSQAIILEKNDSDAIDALWLVRIINTILVILLALIVVIGNKYLCTLLKNDTISVWLYLIPVSIFFNGQNEIYRVWANRKKRYKLMTQNSIISAILVPVFSIGLGLYIIGPLGLFIGLMASQLIPSILLSTALRKNDNFGFQTLNFKAVKRIILKYKKFPIYGLPSEFINRLTNQLPVFFLNSYSGLATVGAYNLTVRMLGLPVSLVSSAIGEVFKQKATEEFYKYGNCRSIFIKTTKLLFWLSIVPSIIIFFGASSIFEIIFGEKWKEAGIIAQYMILFYWSKFIVSPLSYVFYIKEKLKEDFILHILMLLTTFGVFHYFYKISNNINLTLLAFSLSYSIIYLIYYILSLTYAGRKISIQAKKSNYV